LKQNQGTTGKETNPLADNTVEGFTDKDNALTPKVNPFRPDLSFEKDKSSKDNSVNRTTEW